MQWQLWTGKCPDLNWAPPIPSLCKDPQQFSIPPQHLPAPAAPAAFSLHEAKAREVISNAIPKRMVTLKVKAFSCFSACVYVSTRRVFTYANKAGTTIVPVQRAHTHICIQCPRSPLCRGEVVALALCFPSVTSLITQGKQQAAKRGLRSGWERGRIPARPAPAKCPCLHRIFGSAARCSPDLGLGGRLDWSDAFIISCPSYLIRRTLYLKSGGVGVFFSPAVSWKKKKKTTFQ